MFAEVTASTLFHHPARERKAIEPEPNALAGLLTTIAKFGGFKAGAANVPTRVALTAASFAGPPLAQIFAEKIEAAYREAGRLRLQLDDLSAKFDEIGKGYSNLRNIRDVDQFHSDRKVLLKKIETLSAEPNVLLLKHLLAEIQELRKDARFPLLDPAIVLEINDSTSHLYGRLTDLETVVTLSHDIRKRFAELGSQLTNLRVLFDRVIAKIADTDARVELTVTCTDAITKGTTLDKTYATLVYRGLPRTTLSLGLLISTVDSVEIGKTDRTSVNNPPGFGTQFAEIDRRDAQVIPFSFLNLMMHDLRLRKWGGTINLTGGFGINPNSGSNQPEFLAGASVGLGSVYLYGGFHWSRQAKLGGGFALDTPVPPGVTVPVVREYKLGPAFGISYRIPIP